MALLAAPVSAPAEEPWLRAVADCGLPFLLVTPADGSRAALDRGLEDLLRLAELPRMSWVMRLDGAADDVAYVADVVGVEPVRSGGADGSGVVAVLGPGVSRAAAAAVDVAGFAARLRVLLVQVETAQAHVVAERLATGDTAAALRRARLVLLRESAAWAVAAASASAADLLRRVAAPAPPARLPALPPGRRHEAPPAGQATTRILPGASVAEPVAQLRAAAARLGVHPGSRLGAVVASVLVAAVAAGSAGWVVLHRQPPAALVPTLRLVQPPSPVPAAPTPRTATMAATWDRTAQVVLFGGATAVGSGHGEPLNDTWRGLLPPAGAWQRITPTSLQPSARLAGAMAADVTDGYVLLFGGEARGDVGLDDTWTYAGGWVQATPRDAPPAGPALAATEPSSGRVLLVTTCCALAAIPTGERMQTWRWTGGDWALLGQAPGWVSTAALVSDPWDGTVVMLADSGGGRAATYVWDGSTWSSGGPGGGPPEVPGTRPRLTYDPRTHTVLAVVTADDGPHTWAFTPGRGWAEQPVVSGPPVVGLVLRDPVDGRALLYGGSSADGEFLQRWFWTGSRWDESLAAPALAPVPTAGFGAAVAAEGSGGGLVLFGGNLADDQTWQWSGGAGWRRLLGGGDTPAAPPPRLGASMAYDPVSHSDLMVGGRLASGDLAADMWAWRDGAWTQLAASGLPPPTVQAPMAWDATRGEAVLLVPDGTPALPTAQTWTWDGRAWSRQHPATSPPLRPEFSMTWDPATGAVLLVVPCCPGAVEPRSETWTWDGSTWRRLQTLHQPPVHATVAADLVHHRTLLVAACCGGFDSESSVGPPQTWSWDGSDWTRLDTAPLPALQDVAAVVADASGVPLLIARVAGAGPRHPLDGLWRWTGRAWLRLV